MLEVELNKAYSPFPKREISSKIEKFCQVCGESSSRVKEINVFPDFFNNNDLNLFSLNSFYLCPKCKKKLEKIILYTENQILYHHKNIYLFVNKHFLSENYNKEDIISIETAERINISFVPNNIIKQRRSKKKNNYEKKKCVKCGAEKDLQAHHIYKIWVFGENGEVVILCSECHKKVENIITHIEKRILENFEQIYWEIIKAIFTHEISFEDTYRYNMRISLVGNNYKCKIKKTING